MRLVLSPRGERRLGGTDAAGLLGLGKYSNPLKTYRRIVEGVVEKPNAKMQRGTRYEPTVRDLYVKATDATLLVLPGKVMMHPDFPWATCSPDAITDGEVLGELKTNNRWSNWSRYGVVPEDYVTQCLWNLWVLDMREAHLFAAFGTDDEETGEFHITDTGMWRIERDPEMDAVFEDVGGRFWRQHIEARRPPVSSPTAAPNEREAER